MGESNYVDVLGYDVLKLGDNDPIVEVIFQEVILDNAIQLVHYQQHKTLIHAADLGTLASEVKGNENILQIKYLGTKYEYEFDLKRGVSNV